MEVWLSLRAGAVVWLKLKRRDGFSVSYKEIAQSWLGKVCLCWELYRLYMSSPLLTLPVTKQCFPTVCLKQFLSESGASQLGLGNPHSSNITYLKSRRAPREQPGHYCLLHCLSSIGSWPLGGWSLGGWSFVCKELVAGICVFLFYRSERLNKYGDQ